MKRVDLTGNRIGFLTVIGVGPSKQFGKVSHSTWNCVCDCGTTTTVETQKLRSGHTKSCGCSAGEPILGRRFGRLVATKYLGKSIYHCVCDCGNEKDIHHTGLSGGRTNSCGCLVFVAATARKTHGQSTKNSREYRAWRNMKTRCYNQNNSHWKQYGQRGITVCDKWLNSFEAFLEDIGMCPAGYQIERINNDGNYEPSNCKWASAKEQSRNKQDTLAVGDGEARETIKAIAERRGINYYTLRAALRAGKDPYTHVPRSRNPLPSQ